MFRLFRRLKFIFLSICLVLVLSLIAFLNNFSFNKNSKELPATTEVKNNTVNESYSKNEDYTADKGYSENEDYTEDNTTNILLLGDTEDSMMIASIDEDNKDIKIIPVKSENLSASSNKDDLLKSIGESNKINLDKFVQIPISELLNMVSILGNITVDVSSEDLPLINNMIPRFYAECEDSNKGKMTLLTQSGVQEINEYQSLAYASVISNDVSKQKDVILSLVNNMKDADFSKYIEIFNSIRPHVDTNLSISDIFKLASSMHDLK